MVRARRCDPPTVGGRPAADLGARATTDTTYYGIPYDPELGLKVSIHHWGDVRRAGRRSIAPSARADVERVRAFLRRRMPAADGPLVDAEVCLYTNTPDETFVIDRHPAAPGVAFASACSGTASSSRR